MFRNIAVLLEDKAIGTNFLNIAMNIAKKKEGNLSAEYVLPLSRTMLNMLGV